jgi:PAS domain S-box-containing protein
MAALTGYDKQTLIGSHASLILDEETIATAQRKRDNLRSGDRSEERLEAEIRTADGETVPCEIRGCRLPETGTEGIRTGGVIRDISDRKDRIQELEESKARLEVLFESSPDMIHVLDTTGSIVETNRKFRDELGYEAGGAVGTDIWEIDHQLTSDEIQSLDGSLSQGESTRFETRYEREDGTDLPVEVHLVKLTVGASERFVALSRDITDRKERQRELVETKDELEALIDAAPLPITSVDKDGRIELWNPAAERVFGWDAEEAVGEVNPIVPDDKRAEHDELRQDVFDGESDRRLETVRETKSGELIPVSLSTAPYRDSDGDIAGAIGILEDITERKQQQREVAESEQRYRTLTETAPDPVVVHRDSEVLYANPAAVALFEGSDPASVVGNDLLSYLPADDRATLEHRFTEVRNGEREMTGFEQTVYNADGRTRSVEIRSRAIQFDDQRAVLSVLTDVTERKAHENALRRLQETTLELLTADAEGEILDIAAHASEELSNVATAPFKFDEEAGTLEPVERSPAMEGFEIELSTVSPEDGRIWDAFVSGEVVQIDGSADSVDSELLDPDEQAVIATLSNHGVLVGTIQEGEQFTERKRELIQLFATNLEAALDIAADADEIREKQERLTQQNLRMTKLNRLNFVFREINKSLVESNTPSEILEASCERLAGVDSYQFAWVSRLEGSDGDIEPAASHGIDPGYFDQITAAAHPLTDLVQRARSTGNAQLVQNILETAEWDTYRDEALSYGYSSVLAVPIAESRGIDRILLIHGKEGEPFSDEEISIQAELGELIGETIQRMESRGHEQDTTKTEIELEIEGQQLVFNRVSSEATMSLEVDGTVPAGDGRRAVFVRVADAPAESITAALDELHAVSEHETLSDEEDAALVRMVLATPTAIDLVEDANGTVRSLESADGTTTLRFGIPNSVNVRSLVESIDEEYAAAELTSRREISKSAVPDTVDVDVEDDLTEKQHEALRTALYGGLYDWPKKSSATELAETLDVAPSTFQYHVRKAEKQILNAVIA